MRDLIGVETFAAIALLVLVIYLDVQRRALPEPVVDVVDIVCVGEE